MLLLELIEGQFCRMGPSPILHEKLRSPVCKPVQLRDHFFHEVICVVIRVHFRSWVYKKQIRLPCFRHCNGNHYFLWKSTRLPEQPFIRYFRLFPLFGHVEDIVLGVVMLFNLEDLSSLKNAVANTSRVYFRSRCFARVSRFSISMSLRI